MATFSYLIDTGYFFRETLLDNNIDENRVRYFIKQAIETDIWNLIKSSLYDKIMELAYTDSLSGKYEILRNDYLAPIIARYAQYYYEYYNFSLTNKGTMEKSSDWSKTIDFQKQVYANDVLVKKITDYENKALCYIKDNIADFPESNLCDIQESKVESATKKFGFY